MEQAPVQIGQFILGKNLGIGAFGKVRGSKLEEFPSCLLHKQTEQPFVDIED